MYVVLIGLVILVFASILPKGKSMDKGATSPQFVKEMEETMEGFLAELEADNQKLIDTMSVMRRDHDAVVRKLSDRMDNLEMQLQEQRQEWHRLAVQRVERREAELVARSQAVEAYVHANGDPLRAVQSAAEPPAVPDNADTPPAEVPVTIKGRYPELFRMHGEGRSVEYIAKKSGMNKGEVSLIIQLAEQEDRKGAQE